MSFFSRAKWLKTVGIIIITITLLGLGVLMITPSLTFPAHRLLFNDYTISPFRAVVEATGKVAHWDRSKRKMTIENGKGSKKLLITTEGEKGIPIKIDGVYIGKTPLNKRLFPGAYEVVAKPEGYIGTIRYLTVNEEHPRGNQVILPVARHYYGDFLDKILELGYKSIPVADYYNKVPIEDNTLILRHDVDRVADYALQMAEIEHARGIKGTYYFRWNTADPEVMRKVKDLGHEVGLHYETLAFYVQEKGIKSVEEVTPAVQEELRRRLKFEIKEFEDIIGDIYTIASHGAPENSRLGLTNFQALMEGENPLEYGLIGTAYGKITGEFTYLSDVGGVWRTFPYDKLENNEGPFYVLIHPVHWIANMER